MSRKPVRSGEGSERCAICTSGLSGAAASADDSRRSSWGGSVPHAVRASVAVATKARIAARAGKEIAMNRYLALALGLLLSNIAHAALDIGDAAPEFTLPAAHGGKVYQFSLADALRKG